MEMENRIDAAPAVASDTLFIATTGGRVAGVSTSDGSEQWVTQLNAAVRAGPAVTGDAVYVGTDAGVVRALSRENN
jgi:outer membrane protein assembly factor BamB